MAAVYLHENAPHWWRNSEIHYHSNEPEHPNEVKHPNELKHLNVDKCSLSSIVSPPKLFGSDRGLIEP